MRKLFGEQLNELHDDLISMGSRCEEAISTAIRTLTEKDPSLIARTNYLEEKIDHKERDIESLCIKLLLLQNPVASDLRKVSAAMRMISDMERIGDQAADIAEISRCLQGTSNQSELHLKKMAEEAVSMVGRAVEAFVQNDLDGANAVIRQDDIVDSWFEKIKQDLVNELAHGEDGEHAIDFLMIAKYLERIGDHATNIAEWVCYSITGTLPGAEDDAE